MRRILSVAALALLALSTSATAQRAGSMANPSPEIGMDAGLSIGLGDIDGTTIQIPAQYIRMGVFMSPALSLEGSLGLTSNSGGGSTVTLYNIGAGALYHFSTSRAARQFYVRPFLNLAGISGGAGSDSDVAFGVGGGLKVPFRDRIATRYEANITTSDGNSALGALAGISFYTR